MGLVPSNHGTATPLAPFVGDRGDCMAYLSPDNHRVTNVTVQDRCPLDAFEHILFVYDPVALQWTLDALAHAGPADPALRPDCTGLRLLRSDR